MAEQNNGMSLTLVLTLMGAVIINLSTAIVHINIVLFLDDYMVWSILPFIIGLLTLFLSWRILLIVSNNHINFGFQLGGLWAFVTFIFDFFLYILPDEGSVVDSIAEISGSLLLYYGLIILIPVVIGLYHSIRMRQKDSGHG